MTGEGKVALQLSVGHQQGCILTGLSLLQLAGAGVLKNGFQLGVDWVFAILLKIKTLQNNLRLPLVRVLFISLQQHLWDLGRADTKPEIHAG